VLFIESSLVRASFQSYAMKSSIHVAPL
jgi:hypothetical protein